MHKTDSYNARFQGFFRKVTARPGLYSVDTPGELAAMLWGYSFAQFDEWEMVPLPGVMLEDFSSSGLAELRAEGLSVSVGRSCRWYDWILTAFPKRELETSEEYRTRWVAALVAAARRHGVIDPIDVRC